MGPFGSKRPSAAEDGFCPDEDASGVDPGNGICLPAA